MPDLLLELFSEEIPARMQRQAGDDLKRLVTNALVDAGLLYEGAQAFATPRRLTLHVVGLPGAQPDRREERKGPRVGAPEAAIAGFLKSAGLASLDQAQKVADGKKGEVYVAVIEKKGRPTPELIAELLPPILRAFPWPKAMRWGEGKADSLRWVRPLRSILCLFGGPHETPEIVPFALDGLTSGDVTYGHRFLAPGPIQVRRFEDYVEALQKAKVVLDASRRKEIILADAKSLAFARGLDLVEDEGLLDEVAGLVEWPVVLMGEFEAEFLDIPPEVIRATIRANQKCFVLRDGDGKLANKFLLVSNLVARDGGAAIAAGNGRVVRARLSDARHFWTTDLADLPDYQGPGQAARPAPRQAEGAGHRVPRKAGHAGRAGRAHRGFGARARPGGRLRAGSGRARRATGQGRSRHRDGRRVPGIAGADGALLRARPGRGRQRRPGDRGALQAAGAGRPRSHLAGIDRRGAGRQARHAGGLLVRSTRNRREARTLSRCDGRRWGAITDCAGK